MAQVAQVVGNDATISFAATMSTLQLNTAMPIAARACCRRFICLQMQRHCSTLVHPRRRSQRGSNEDKPPSAAAIITYPHAPNGYDAPPARYTKPRNKASLLPSCSKQNTTGSQTSITDAWLAMARPNDALG
jgi:fumarate hydratase class II